LILVDPLRTGGFAAVAWTAIVCCLKVSGRDVEEVWVFIGWAVIFAIAAALSLYSDICERREWQQRLEMSGLLKTAKEAGQLLENFMLDDVVTGKASKALADFNTRLVEARSAENVARAVILLETFVSADRLVGTDLHNFKLSTN